MDPEDRLELIAMLANNQAWQVVIRVGEIVLDKIYPADIFDGSSGDSGPEYIVALRKALERVTSCNTTPEST